MPARIVLLSLHHGVRRIGLSAVPQGLGGRSCCYCTLGTHNCSRCTFATPQHLPFITPRVNQQACESTMIWVTNFLVTQSLQLIFTLRPTVILHVHLPAYRSGHIIHRFPIVLDIVVLGHMAQRVVLFCRSLPRWHRGVPCLDPW